MEISNPRTLAPFISLIAFVALLCLSGCSGLTSSGLSNHTTAQSSNGGGGTDTTSVAISTTAVNFGSVAIGVTSTQQVTVTNTGTVKVTVSENAVSGADFSANGIGSGLILDPAQKATLEVSFTPTGTGRATGSVPLVSSAWSAPVIIALSGTGTATQAGGHVARLAWDPSSSAVAGYNAYRGARSGGPYTRLNSSLLLSTSYSDTTAVSGQVYFYVVTSVDSLNLESSYSNEVSATIPSP